MIEAVRVRIITYTATLLTQLVYDKINNYENNCLKWTLY